MRVEDIKDRKSLEAWLNARPQASRRADAISISHRAALRVLPLWVGAIGEPWAEKIGLNALPILRSNLAAAVCLKSPELQVRLASREISYLANLAASSVSSSAVATASVGVATTYVADAAYSAHYGAIAPAVDAVAVAADAVAANADEGDASVLRISFWSEIAADVQDIARGHDPTTLPLWHGTPADWFKQRDNAAHALWSSEPEVWSFWLRWWDGVIAGSPLPDDLMLKVASIPERTWRAGQHAVAAAIRGIETHHDLDTVISQNPYAWRIVFDPRRQTFEAVAIEPRDLSEIVTSVRGLIKDFHKRCDKLGVGNFGASVKLAFEPVIDFLRRDMRRHAASPLSLLKAIEAARREMQEIADKEHFAGESYLTRFFLGLQDCAEDICVAAPEIVEQLKAKEAVRYELFSMERRRATMLQVFGLHLDADGMLKRVALDALRVIGDDAASDADKKEAWYFATAVLPRAARAYLAETLDKDEELKPPSKVAMTKRVVEAADALAKLDKGKDALQENIPQLTDWVNQIVEAVGTWSV